MWEPEPLLGTQGWQEGTGQPSLPTGLLGGGAQAGALPQGILVVTGAAPAPGLPAADAAHSRDAAAAVGHVAATDRAGPEAVGAAAASTADDGCRGRAGQHPSARAGGSRSNGLGRAPVRADPCPWGKITLRQFHPCPALGFPSLYPTWLLISQRPISFGPGINVPTRHSRCHPLPFLVIFFAKFSLFRPLLPADSPIDGIFQKLWFNSLSLTEKPRDSPLSA